MPQGKEPQVDTDGREEAGVRSQGLGVEGWATTEPTPTNFRGPIRGLLHDATMPGYHDAIFIRFTTETQRHGEE